MESTDQEIADLTNYFKQMRMCERRPKDQEIADLANYFKQIRMCESRPKRLNYCYGPRQLAQKRKLDYCYMPEYPPKRQKLASLDLATTAKEFYQLLISKCNVSFFECRPFVVFDFESEDFQCITIVFQFFDKKRSHLFKYLARKVCYERNDFIECLRGVVTQYFPGVGVTKGVTRGIQRSKSVYVYKVNFCLYGRRLPAGKIIYPQNYETEISDLFSNFSI